MQVGLSVTCMYLALDHCQEPCSAMTATLRHHEVRLLPHKLVISPPVGIVQAA